MNDLKKRLDALKEHKETLKHMRGRHDQRSHNRWPEGYTAQVYKPVGRGGGGGDMPNVLSRRGKLLNNISGGTMASPPSLILANQNPSSLLANQKRRRVERLANTPLDQQKVDLAARRRESARLMQAQWKQRHRNTKPTADYQGTVSPQAMYGTEYTVPYALPEQDNDLSLFEDPRKIEGVDGSGNKTNFLDFFNNEMDRIQDQFINLLSAAGVPDSEMEDVEDANGKVVKYGYLGRLMNYSEVMMQGVLRKAAASYAMDIQGFVGGQIYGNSDPEFADAMRMAGEANSVIQKQRDHIVGLVGQIRQKHNVNDLKYTDFVNNIEDVFAAWQMANSPPTANGKPVDVRQLARTNPALASDILERLVENPSGAGLASPRRQEIEAGLGLDIEGNLPPTSTDRLTMSLGALMSFLHPKTRESIARLASDTIVYPRMENPSDAIKISPVRKVSPEVEKAIDATAEIIDMLHTDGGLTTALFIDDQSDPGIQGYFSASHASMVMNRLPDQNAPYIASNSDASGPLSAPSPIMSRINTLAHEFGHLIDSSAMGYGTAYWRDRLGVVGAPDGVFLMTNYVGESGGPGEMPEKAPMAEAIMNMLDLYYKGNGVHLLQLVNAAIKSGNIQGAMRLSAFSQYLNQPTEIFARFYQQWVSTQIYNRLKSGQSVPGVEPSEVQAAIDTLDQEIFNRRPMAPTGQVPSGTIPFYFEDSMYKAMEKEMLKIFAIMGWQTK